MNVVTDWAALYDREYPRLLRALTAMGGDAGAAEDAIQEAFVKAHKHGLEGIGRPGAWLLVVGTRELSRQRHRLRRERTRWEDHGGVSTGAAYDAATDRADLRAALRELTERQRAIVVARFYLGLSYEEIANSFGVKDGTVAAALHQGLAKLRQVLLAGKLIRGATR